MSNTLTYTEIFSIKTELKLIESKSFNTEYGSITLLTQFKQSTSFTVGLLTYLSTSYLLIKSSLVIEIEQHLITSTDSGSSYYTISTTEIKTGIKFSFPLVVYNPNNLYVGHNKDPPLLNLNI